MAIKIETYRGYEIEFNPDEDRFTWVMDNTRNGKNSFSGIDAVYFQGQPVWASSYFGKFKGITEDKLDEILSQSKLPGVPLNISISFSFPYGATLIPALSRGTPRRTRGLTP